MLGLGRHLLCFYKTSQLTFKERPSICTKFIPQFFKLCLNFRDKSLTFSITLEAQSSSVASVLPGVKIHNCNTDIQFVCEVKVSFWSPPSCFTVLHQEGYVTSSQEKLYYQMNFKQSLPLSFVRSYRKKRYQLTRKYSMCLPTYAFPVFSFSTWQIPLTVRKPVHQVHSSQKSLATLWWGCYCCCCCCCLQVCTHSCKETWQQWPALHLRKTPWGTQRDRKSITLEATNSSVNDSLELCCSVKLPYKDFIEIRRWHVYYLQCCESGFIHILISF